MTTALQTAAQEALSQSDINLIRAYETGTQVPSEWSSYRNALRAIVNGSDIISTILPTKPPYPSVAEP